MFEQSVIDTSGRRSGALAVSVTAQSIAVGILILIPLLYNERLPLVPPLIPLILPVSAPPLPEPVETSSAPASPHASILPTRVFHPPSRPYASSVAPIGLIATDALPPSNDGAGSPGGVPFATGIEMPRIIVSTPPAPPVVSKPPDQPHAVGGDVQAAKLIRRVVPLYPPIARQAHVSGAVHLTGIIAKDGSIRQLQVISGNPLLVRAALDAVRQWLYKPTLLNGEAVEVIAPINVIFTLSQ